MQCILRDIEDVSSGVCFTPYFKFQLWHCDYAQVTGIPKEAAEDTSISVGNSSGKQTTVPIPKGADITISTVGLHYNRAYLYFQDWFNDLYVAPARYWNDPHSFKPARFLKDWPRDAFIPFSNGINFYLTLSRTEALMQSRCPCMYWQKVRLYFASAFRISYIDQKQLGFSKPKAWLFWPCLFLVIRYLLKRNPNLRQRPLNSEKHGCLLLEQGSLWRTYFYTHQFLHLKFTCRPIRVPLTFTRRGWSLWSFVDRR